MSVLKGYNYCNVSLKKLQKEKFILSSEIEAQITRNELKGQMENILTNNGRVYFISRKKEVCGVVIVRYEKHLASDFEFETEKADEEQAGQSQTDEIGTSIMEQAVEFEAKHQIGKKKGKENAQEKVMTANAYVLEALYLNEDMKSKDMMIMQDLVEELKEAATFNDLGVKVIIWNDTIIKDKTIGKTSESAMEIGICIGLALGFLFGLMFDNVGFGMCIGLAVGVTIGASYYSSSKKKTVKKQGDDSNA